MLHVGDTVEFPTSYPSAPKGSIARGTVIDVGSIAYPRNPTMLSQFGAIEFSENTPGLRVVCADCEGEHLTRQCGQ